MKDQLTTLLSDVIQHQVELQSGFETIIRHAEQSGDAQRAKVLMNQIEQFNARVTALSNALGAHWVPTPGS